MLQKVVSEVGRDWDSLLLYVHFTTGETPQAGLQNGFFPLQTTEGPAGHTKRSLEKPTFSIQVSD